MYLHNIPGNQQVLEREMVVEHINYEMSELIVYEVVEYWLYKSFDVWLSECLIHGDLIEYK